MKNKTTEQYLPSVSFAKNKNSVFMNLALTFIRFKKRLLQTWPLFCTVGQLSHASPTPSRSPSSCSELCTIRQLSIEFNTPRKKKEASSRCEHKYGKTQVDKKGNKCCRFPGRQTYPQRRTFKLQRVYLNGTQTIRESVQK